MSTHRLTMLEVVTRILRDNPDLPAEDALLSFGTFPRVDVCVADKLDVHHWAKALDTEAFDRPSGFKTVTSAQVRIDGVAFEVHASSVPVPPSYDVHTEQALSIVRGSE